MADITDELIMLERSCEEARAALAGLDGEEYAAQWRRWADAAERFQAAVTTHAEETSQPRHVVEMAAKKAVRRAEEDPVE
ncbi:hypothetical protein GCM10010277_81060 [Streptomyces longisporoflavus]|uniref:hypothetical protein n=1 Tax=Streptomyces longisporoflavus TaxID=28044 RepID=UPI0019C874AD|nr:hypothetical protein [Streptomyces longisporoflavus]GGV70236.1 hypothetical protein GCM10010277_81060 [Streptomyces longisporoflavus]